MLSIIYLQSFIRVLLVYRGSKMSYSALEILPATAEDYQGQGKVNERTQYWNLCLNVATCEPPNLVRSPATWCVDLDASLELLWDMVRMTGVRKYGVTVAKQHLAVRKTVTRNLSWVFDFGIVVTLIGLFIPAVIGACVGSGSNMWISLTSVGLVCFAFLALLKIQLMIHNRILMRRKQLLESMKNSFKIQKIRTRAMEFKLRVEVESIHMGEFLNGKQRNLMLELNKARNFDINGAPTHELCSAYLSFTKSLYTQYFTAKGYQYFCDAFVLLYEDKTVKHDYHSPTDEHIRLVMQNEKFVPAPKPHYFRDPRICPADYPVPVPLSVQKVISVESDSESEPEPEPELEPTTKPIIVNDYVVVNECVTTEGE